MRLAAFSLFLVPLLLVQLTAVATLSVCTETNPEGLDVVQYNLLTTTSTSAGVLMSRLVGFDAGKGTVVPSLAEYWSVSGDGLSYRLGLYQGVHFHSTVYFKPSRTLDADDVVFSFQRIPDLASLRRKVTQSDFPHAQSMQLSELIKRVKESSDHQVLVVLDHPDTIFPPMLSIGFASIHSVEYADQLMKAGTPEKLNTAPIGSGLFVFKHLQKGTVAHYTVSPEYFAGEPVVDTLISAITSDANVRLRKLRHGEYQIALSPKPLDMESTRKGASLKAEQTPAFMTAFVALNTQHPPLDDPKVCQAINLASGRTSYLQAVFGGNASATTGIYPPSTWSYVRDIPAYPHDPEQVCKLLADRQLPELNIWARPSGSLFDPDPGPDAQLLQADLAKAGIKANTRIIERGELIRRAKNDEHSPLFMGWAGDDGDLDNPLTLQFSCASVKSGLSFACYRDPNLDKLITDGKAANSQEQCTGLYHQAQKLIREQTLWLPLVHPTTFALTCQEVQGYQVSPFGRQDFSRVAVER